MGGLIMYGAGHRVHGFLAPPPSSVATWAARLTIALVWHLTWLRPTWGWTTAGPQL